MPEPGGTNARPKRPAEAIPEILRGTGPSSQKAEKKVQPDLSEQEIRAMPIEKILDLASNKETSRKHLEQIASVRFGVTRGGALGPAK
jgi:hypothetical protein